MDSLAYKHLVSCKGSMETIFVYNEANVLIRLVIPRDSRFNDSHKKKGF